MTIEDRILTLEAKALNIHGVVNSICKHLGIVPEDTPDEDRTEAITSLGKWQASDDVEAAHVEADKILCVLLRKLGYGEVVDEWNKVRKW